MKWVIVLVPVLFLLAAEDVGRNREEGGWRAFIEASAVLTHPRCLNCHVPGDSPLQGDNGNAHNMNVRRAGDGRGTPAARCTNCHQAANSPAPHSPPGVAGWRMPPPSMRMAWQGLSREQLCRTLKDPARNGGKTLAQLLEHVKNDALVQWGWDPGPGRKLPPLSHEQFVARIAQWTESGGPCGPAQRSADER